MMDVNGIDTINPMCVNKVTVFSSKFGEKNLLTKREHMPFCKLIQSTLTL